MLMLSVFPSLSIFITSKDYCVLENVKVSPEVFVFCSFKDPRESLDCGVGII